MKNSKKGFTLIELLVVIAIIAILAAILFPVFLKVQQTSYVTSCVNNMRQWGTALQSYLGDYDNKFPYAGSNGWYPHKPGPPPPFGKGKNIGSDTCYNALKRYTGGNEAIKWCPMWKKWYAQSGHGAGNWADSAGWSYWYYCNHGNSYVSAHPKCILCGYRMSDVSKPGKKPFIGEVNAVHQMGDGAWSMSFCYCDGHARAVTVLTSEDVMAASYAGRDGSPGK